MAYVRTVKTASGATAVQIVWSSRRGSRNIEHVGSAHDEAQVEALKAAAVQRIADGQGELDLGLDLTEIGKCAIGNHRLTGGVSVGWLVPGPPPNKTADHSHAAEIRAGSCPKSGSNIAEACRTAALTNTAALVLLGNPRNPSSQAC